MSARQPRRTRPRIACSSALLLLLTVACLGLLALGAFVPRAILAASDAATIAATATASDLEARYQATAAGYHALRNNPAATAEDWARVAEGFAALAEASPGARRAPDALYSAALAWRKGLQTDGGASFRQRTRAGFQAFLEAFPQHRLADDALMHLALLWRDAYRDPATAALLCHRILEEYPAGDQAARAADLVATLEEEIASGSLPLALHQPEGAGRKAERALLNLQAAAFGAPSGQSWDQPALLQDVASFSAAGETRIVLTSQRPLLFRHARLAAGEHAPERVYLDLMNTTPAEDIAPEWAVQDRIVDRIRISARSATVTRVVLDLATDADYALNSYQLPGEYKLVIELQADVPVLPPEPGPQELVQRPEGAERELNAELALVAQAARPIAQVASIVIDAGHGGRDPGAVAYGVLEKDVTLDLAKGLRDMLKIRHPDVRVGLTREDDTFVPLRERPAIAKALGADLFVSIHINANPFERFHGVEVYFLNNTTDANALQVAARENGAEHGEGAGVSDILLDLLRDSNMVESSALAETLQATLIGNLREQWPGVRDLGVKQAPFLVLAGAEMPSVLVEAGFLTNEEENLRLRDPSYLNGIVQGIYAGLRQYIDTRTIVQQPVHTPSSEDGADTPAS